MSHTARRIGGRILIILGVLDLVAVVGLYLWGAVTGQHVELPHLVIGIGMVFGFVGFYMETPTESKDGATFLVTSVERLARVLPLGRRKTDPVILVDEKPKDGGL